MFELTGASFATQTCSADAIYLVWKSSESLQFPVGLCDRIFKHHAVIPTNHPSMLVSSTFWLPLNFSILDCPIDSAGIWLNSVAVGRLRFKWPWVLYQVPYPKLQILLSSFPQVCKIFQDLLCSRGLMTLAVPSKYLFVFVYWSLRLLGDLPARFVSGDSEFLCPSLMSFNFLSSPTTRLTLAGSIL